VTELEFRLVGTVPRMQLGSTGAGFEPLTTQNTKPLATILHKIKIKCSNIRVQI
jgi:hypothetical protein